MKRAYRILLVEDSRTQAVVLTDAFEREGWQVDWVLTVDSALERLGRTPPDLIVLDYYLPGIRGDRLCHRLRMNVDMRGIPILMLTMDETGIAEVRGLESGADDFVSKSADTGILLARVRALLGRSSPQPAILGSTGHFYRPARLLTIDDSPTYREYLAGELQQEGYQIEAASSGRDGLERIVREPFDCALVDLVMPGMSGIELCRQVTELRRATDNPIALLMLTGRESKEDLTQALEAGADDFVGKSSDMAVLKGRIRALLRRKFYQEENRRIVAELKNKEMEMLRAKADKDVAEAKAALNDELEMRVVARTRELADANRRLAEQHQENEMYVFGASHDLRTPLVTLTGFSMELAQICGELRSIFEGSDLPGAIKERGLTLVGVEVAEHVRVIQSAVKRLSDIIDAMLRVSRVGRVEYRRQDVDVQGVVQRVIDSLCVVVTERAAQISILDLPPAQGDETAIEQVFANLIGNALIYLDPTRPGMIEVGCHTGHTRDGIESACHIYYVRDNGRGIPKEYQCQLFQAFKRLQPDAAPGEGIGLTIVRRIVERHDGKVWVESASGIGSTFFIALPAAIHTSEQRETVAV